MSLKGTLSVGSSCRITIDSAVATPGTLAVALLWIPNPAGTTPAPDVFAVAPGGKIQRSLVVPSAQMLLVDLDLPSVQGGGATIVVEQGAVVVAEGVEGADATWTFLVV